MQLLIEPGPGNKQASRRLEKLEKRLGGSTELMGEIAELVKKRNEKRFKRVKLRSATIEYKAQYGESTEPLVESGKMKEELTTDKGVKVITNTELQFGSRSLAEGEGRGRQITVTKATLATKGTKHQSKKLTLRPTPTDRREISELVMEYITRDV
jgi:phage gpG-like protein